jgi:hypothetical protein
VSPCPQEAGSVGAFFLSTSRRNQWALDALGKQPVAHFPTPRARPVIQGAVQNGCALVFSAPPPPPSPQSAASNRKRPDARGETICPGNRDAGA